MQSESKSKQKHSGDSAMMKTVVDLKRSDTLWLIRLFEPPTPLFRISLFSFLRKDRGNLANYLALGELSGWKKFRLDLRYFRTFDTLRLAELFGRFTQKFYVYRASCIKQFPSTSVKLVNYWRKFTRYDNNDNDVIEFMTFIANIHLVKDWNAAWTAMLDAWNVQKFDQSHKWNINGTGGKLQLQTSFS